MSRHNNNQGNTNSNVNEGGRKNKLESGTNIGKQKSSNNSHKDFQRETDVRVRIGSDHGTKKDIEDFTLFPTDKIKAHIEHHRDQIVSHLKMSLELTGKTGPIKNVYHVPGYNQHAAFNSYSSKRGDPTMNAKELILDAAKKIRLNTFLRDDSFFNKQQLGPYLPEREIEILTNTKYKMLSDKEEKKSRSSNKNELMSKSCTTYKYSSCGVVSSAGSLLHSGLGKDIDSNDFVIRFNNAPLKGYEKDVGNKTSLRIVNSQVVGKPEFGFLDDRKTKDLYTKTPVLVWDPSNYNASLEEWYSSPDFPFFETYFKKRLMRPDSEVHLLDPRSLWSIWDWLQSIQGKSLLMPNPPSSGFLGLILAVFNCEKVNVYEFVPSTRMTKRCHYYDNQQNIGCTIGDWHPLAAEKLAALRMNVGNDTQVFKDGYLTIPGLLSLKSEKCPS